MRRIPFAIGTMLLLLAGHTGLLARASAEKELVWVMLIHKGDRLCWHPGDSDQRDTVYSPEIARENLRKARVKVVQEYITYMNYCESCECPAYTARHYVQISRRDLKAANEAGFDSPESAGRNRRRR